MALQPSWKAILGIAKEVTPGTPVAPTAFIPVNAITPKRIITQLEDKSWRGSAVDQHDQVQGPWHSEIEIPGDVYPDTFGWFLASIFGDVVTTVLGAGVNNHRFATLNSGTQQPGAKTLTDFYVAAARAYGFGMCVELSIKSTADGKLTYTSKWVSEADVAAATPVAAYSTEKLIAAWRCVPTLFAATPKLLEAEFNIKRTFDVVHTANNSQDPLAIFQGPIAVDGKLTLVMEDDVYLNHFLGNTQSNLALQFSTGAGATLRGVDLGCAKAAFKESNIDRGSSFVKLDTTFVGLANATDAGASLGTSPASCQVQNTLAAATYA